LVLNAANRDPGTLAVMAATLQHLSAGRLLVGMGAGARSGTPYAIEQEALGHVVASDAERRVAVEDNIMTLRQVWSGTVPPATGFLRPDPVPPIVVAALGPKMAELAGRVGDGVCVSVGSRMTELIAVAREAHALSSRHARPLLVTALLSSWPQGGNLLVPDDVGRLIVYVAPPFDEAIARLDEVLSDWRRNVPRQK
jgi:alkanesulfonate monooxygenase SsuD/methylene tetrahydromethanopterin reductase-like flavin-dependent oxidoreductase (luciferase family)